MSFRAHVSQLGLWDKLWHINWGLVLALTVVSMIGFVTLYSAANGSLDPWASRQMMRFAVGFVLMLAAALIDIRVWWRYAYVIYGLVLIMLVGVGVAGEIGKGAQRWINLGILQIQPSEIMRLALAITLARYFHGASHEDLGRPLFLVPPLALVMVPVWLVVREPDLGTALLLLAGSGLIFFLAGVRLWMFGSVLAAGLAIIPVAWEFLNDYQRKRVIVFLNPESDPLGAGYHITQSKIALGSGGILGKGFLLGTQSHLNFLPEKQTDFIFTMLAEEWGLVGGVVLLTLYLVILVYGFAIALRCRNQFGRLLAMGLTATFFLYVFINIAMVMGLVPVVGVPLPMISYGGTSMLTLMIGFGLVMGVYIHRDIALGRRGASED